ncbi:acyl-CoA dehydrogenase family protein [Streptomyces sp. NBC_00019]|uniref:acyl-CoA dehydrogenase family protein n=1 Tax=Streptomyces sp. NBC_00019 TaxID=2975623 RepID=UPI002F91BC0C
MSRYESSPLRLPELLSASVKAAAEDVEAGRDLPDKLMQELRDSGAFRLLTPRELGGFEAPLETVLKVYEGFGRLEVSVAWVVWNTNWGFLAALLGNAGTARIWADGPDPVFANASQPGTAVVTEGGYRLSGTWKHVGGVDRADWLVVVAVVVENGDPRLTQAGTPDVRLFTLSRDQLSVQDSGDVSGMPGTGSNTVAVDDVLVPDELVARFDEPDHAQHPRSQGFIPTLVFPGCSAVVLGVAQSAIDEVVVLATNRSTPTDGTLAESARAHVAVARSEAALHAARLLLLSTAAAVDAATEKGEPVTLDQRAALHAAMCHATDVSREVLVAMHELGGSASTDHANPVARLFRDGMLALQHANHFSPYLEAAGRVRFGFEPGIPLF